MYFDLAIINFLKLLVFIGTPGLMIVFFLVSINRIKEQAITTKMALRVGLMSALKALLTMFILCILVVFAALIIFRNPD